MIRTSVVLLLLPAGCGLLQREPDRFPADDLQALDAMFGARHQRGMLDSALEGYRLLMADHPGEPAIMARVSLAAHATGYGYEEGSEAIHYYKVGMQTAWGCLLQHPGFKGQVEASAGAVERAALRTLSPDYAPCLVGLVESWSRWVHLVGAGAASLDLETVAPMAGRAVQLMEQEPSAGLPGLYTRARVAEARARALMPLPLRPDQEEAEKLFWAACLDEPSNLTCMVDLAAHLLGPQGRQAEFSSVLEEVVETPRVEDVTWRMENRRARERATVLLEEGLPLDGYMPRAPR